MRIEYDQRASRSPAYALIAEAWVDMVQNDATVGDDGVCPVRPEHEVLYATSDEGDLVGVLVYETNKTLGEAKVVLAYVEPSSRRRGVFKALRIACVDRCVADGCGAVTLEVDALNQSAQHALRRMAVPVVTLVFDLLSLR